MIFKQVKHDDHLYNILLSLSRNIFFYKDINLQDTYETRIYLMFFHFSILMIIFKNKGKKFDQNQYDKLFNNIENNLRELGYGDIAVNKKMKDLNKILYDILLKIKPNFKEGEVINFNQLLFSKYFEELKGNDNLKYKQIKSYFSNFYNYCSKLSLDNILKEVINFKNHGSS